MPQTTDEIYQSLLAQKTSRPLTEGARLKNFASKELEALIKQLLDPLSFSKAQFRYNCMKDLEIRIDGRFYNLSEILKSNPDFEHLELTQAEIEGYVSFVNREKGVEKPVLAGKTMPTLEDYNKADPQGKHAFLEYGERLAITTYTGNSFSLIQDFLRNFGRDASLQTLNHDQLKIKASELLLCSCVAAHGLREDTNRFAENSEEEIDDLPEIYSKWSPPTLIEKPTETTDELKPALIRMETFPLTSQIMQQRAKDIRGQRVSQIQGFLSTSLPNVPFGDKNVRIFYTTIGHGKNIRELSKNPKEEEILFPPRVEIQFQVMSTEGNYINLLATPVRTIELAELLREEYTLEKKIRRQLQVLLKGIDLLKDQELVRSIRCLGLSSRTWPIPTDDLLKIKELLSGYMSIKNGASVLDLLDELHVIFTELTLYEKTAIQAEEPKIDLGLQATATASNQGTQQALQENREAPTQVNKAQEEVRKAAEAQARKAQEEANKAAEAQAKKAQEEANKAAEAQAKKAQEEANKAAEAQAKKEQEEAAESAAKTEEGALEDALTQADIREINKDEDQCNIDTNSLEQTSRNQSRHLFFDNKQQQNLKLLFQTSGFNSGLEDLTHMAIQLNHRGFSNSAAKIYQIHNQLLNIKEDYIQQRKKMTAEQFLEICHHSIHNMDKDLFSQDTGFKFVIKKILYAIIDLVQGKKAPSQLLKSTNEKIEALKDILEHFEEDLNQELKPK